MRTHFDALEQAEPRDGWRPEWAAPRHHRWAEAEVRDCARVVAVAGSTVPRSISGWIAAALVAAAIALLGVLRVPGFGIPVVITLLVAGVVAAVIGTQLQYRSLLRHSMAARAPHAEWVVRIGPDHIFVQSAKTVLVLPLVSIRTVRESSGCVLLRLKGRHGWIGLHPDLLPDHAGEWIADRAKRPDPDAVGYRFTLPPA